jgi:hypothetical protein
LEKYNQEGYYVSNDGLKTEGTFEVNFYYPSASGFSHLKTKRITLNPSDPLYKSKLASAVSLMVKNMYTIVISQKGRKGLRAINIVYADQFGILDESYMKVNFYSNQITGTLENDYYEDYYQDDKDRVQWKDSVPYKNLKKGYKKGAFTLKNSYPLWLFAETEDHSYNEIIAQIFKEAASENPIYPQQKFNIQWFNIFHI